MEKLEIVQVTFDVGITSESTRHTHRLYQSRRLQNAEYAEKKERIHIVVVLRSLQSSVEQMCHGVCAELETARHSASHMTSSLTSHNSATVASGNGVTPRAEVIA